MEWITHLNQAMEDLEAHLTEEPDWERLARIACCSSYHFQRMFTYMAGVSLSEYLRRRRMSLAAVDLQNGGRVLDVALGYGYTSPTAFSRAFQGIHGVTPSAAQEGAPVKSYPPIRFHMTVTGGQELQYRIERREAFRIVGLAAPLEQEIEKNFQTVPRLWERVSGENVLPRLLPMMDGEPKGLLGVSACCGEEWTYYIAVASSWPAGDFAACTVPAFTWAVFSGEGRCPQAIQDLERRVVTGWLPSSGYEYGDGPDIEVYLAPDPQNAKFQVWIPVVKK